MRTGILGALRVLLAIVFCAGAGLAADTDITFTSSGAIKDGDSYDDVFVYGDKTVVDVTGGTIGKVWSHNSSTVNITGGRVMYAESFEYGTINISGGIVSKPSVWAAGGTINVTGGTCWNVEVGAGRLNLFGGTITGIGISVPAPGGSVNIHGYGFAFYPSLGRNDGRLEGIWRDGTAFSIDFQENAYQAVVLHEIVRDAAPVAEAGDDLMILASVGTTAQVTLDGSASSDPNFDKLTYKWNWVVGGQTYGAVGVKPTITLPIGIHTIELIVNDGTADSMADRVVITVRTPAQQVWVIRANSLRLVNETNAMLQEQRQIVEAFDEMLATGNYGGLSLESVLAARETVYLSMGNNEQVRKALLKSVSKLDDTLLLLGASPGMEPPE